MKQHAALIGLWAAVAFAVDRLGQTSLSAVKRLGPVAVLGAGLVLPIGLCCLILWHAGVFEKFWFWTIDYARQYESVVPLDQAPRLFWERLCRLAGADPLLWLVAVTGLGLVWFDGRLRPTRLWLLGFCLMSALTVVPGFYFRKHYFLLTLPAAALLAGCAVSGANRLGNSRFGGWLVWCYALMVAATIMAKSGVWFIRTPEQIARDTYGADPLRECELIAGYIQDNSSPDARVTVLGSEPAIYFLARRHSATGYIYTYGLMEEQPFARQMQDEMIREIGNHPPEFIVFADNPCRGRASPLRTREFSIGGILIKPTIHWSRWLTSFRQRKPFMFWVRNGLRAMARIFTGAAWRFINVKPTGTVLETIMTAPPIKTALRPREWTAAILPPFIPLAFATG